MLDSTRSPFFLLQLALVGIGLIQVFSTSFIFASDLMASSYYFFIRQSLFVVMGLIITLLVAQLDLQKVKEYGWLLWPACVLAVLLTLVPGIGVKVGGAARWIQGPFGLRLEPSEFLKVGFCLWLASIFCIQEIKIFVKFKWYVTLALSLIPIALLLKQPDFGSVAVLVLIFFTVLFAMGLKLKWFVFSVMGLAPVFYFLVMQVSYRRERILGFLDPWTDPQGRGFQVIQSMMTFSRGGLSGEGFGQGQGKLFFLPEAHTDFTLAVLGEELGFIGFVVLLSLYLGVTLLGFQLVVRLKDQFSKILALGLTLFFTFSSIINMGVVMGLLPTKGLTLPFLSYGGSSMLTMSLTFGILMLLERQTHSR